jgi:hypothetical protein
MFGKAMALTFVAAAVAAGSAQAAATSTPGQQHEQTEHMLGVPVPASATKPGPSIGQLHEQTEHMLGVPVPASATKPGPSIGQLHEQTERALGVPAPGVGVVVTSVPSTGSATGFSWTDALIGAAMAAGIFLLGGAGALTLRRRRRLARR